MIDSLVTPVAANGFLAEGRKKKRMCVKLIKIRCFLLWCGFRPVWLRIRLVKGNDLLAVIFFFFLNVTCHKNAAQFVFRLFI